MPVIFEPPAALLSGDLELWIAASGGPNWGGAQVWLSLDNASYAPAGEIQGGSITGTLSAPLANYTGAEPDTTNTLSVDLSQSRGQLSSVSAALAQDLVTLCWVDGELLAFQTATLGAPYKYNLATLWRGAYGSTIGSHAAGSLFARIDGSQARLPYPPALVGTPIWLKFASFNLTGGNIQALSGLTAYTYTPKGPASAQVIRTSTAITLGSLNNLVIFNPVSGVAFTATLPPNPRDGQTLRLKYIGSFSAQYPITLAANTGQTVDGGASVRLIGQNASLDLSWSASLSEWLLG